MAQPVCLPDPRALLPPLLACLPTAFASPRPPPALLPLLTPILRQRVQLLSGSASNSASWLTLLCWDREISAKLPSVIERIQLEPHPVSGEIEFQDVDTIEYRRLDTETLQCRLYADEFELLPIYLWCTGDNQGWRLAELRTSADKDDGSQWHTTLQEANEAASVQRSPNRKPSSAGQANGAKSSVSAEPDKNAPRDDEDDDSAYWAAYDCTPGRTPAKQSPAPRHKSNSAAQVPNANELEYFARYLAEVQPAMDPHDPTEYAPGPGESTLSGNTFHHASSVEAAESAPDPKADSNIIPADTHSSHVPLTNGNIERKDAKDDGIVHPRPSSPSSSMSGSVARLERQDSVATAAEIGIKQHISTDIKSLFRLAKSAGIDRAEFERLVRTELEVLSMMDME